MTTLTVTAKGQITLRGNILRHLGVRPGDRISVEMHPGGRIEVKAEQPTREISEVFDALKRPGAPALTIDEIGAIAARGWAGER